MYTHAEIHMLTYTCAYICIYSYTYTEEDWEQAIKLFLMLNVGNVTWFKHTMRQ